MRHQAVTVRETYPHPPPGHGRPAESGDVLSRGQRVAAAAAQWAKELSAVGGRDPLLAFREHRHGTLDLAAAEPENRQRLLDGDPVTVSRLFPHEPLRTPALRSARAIRDKARELAEDRGIDAAKLAVGIATWSSPFAVHRPAAPVLLREAAVTARDPAETDFVLQVGTELTVNPVLLHALDTQLGLRFSEQDLRDAAGELRYPVVVERLNELAPAHVVDGFSISHRALISTFATEPLLASRDVAAFGGDLASHDVIAALAGDRAAMRRLRDADAAPVVQPENLVHDADAAQAGVIAAVAAGRQLRVDAPPGTGRTQTAANLVAELVARGQRALVVGQHRATLGDLVARLTEARLGDLVLDLASGPLSTAATRAVVERAGRPKAFDVPERSAAGEPAGDDGELERYLDTVHHRRDPWGCSAYDVMAAVAAADAEARTEARVPRDKLELLGFGTREALRARLRTYVELGGLSEATDNSPWARAIVPTSEAANELRWAVKELRSSALPALRNAVTRAAVEAGLSAPRTAAEAFDTVDLLSAVADTMNEFRPEIWTAPLDDYVAATADRRRRAEHSSRLHALARRRLVLQGRALLRDPAARGRRGRADLHARLQAAQDQLRRWRERARDARPPRTGPHLPAATEVVATVRSKFALLAEADRATADLPELPFPELADRLARLARAEDALLALPRLAELRSALESAGFSALLDELRGREPEPEPDDAEAAFSYAWQASLLDKWRDDDPVLREFDPAVHERRLAEFRDSDAAAPVAAGEAVLARHARRFAEVAADHAGQAAVVSQYAESGTAPRTLRDLVAAAPDVSLAAVPCWVMPPLRAAEVLPARRLFDVVIIEDAGLLEAAQAVPALARGDRVVLFGDEEQLVLPPFTTAVEAAEQDEQQPAPESMPAALWESPPPVTEALADALSRLPLTTAYRVRDDRLIGFAARGLYRDRLTVPPGVGGPPGLHHELVPAVTDSSAAEVQRVVELVLEHVRTRPHESLGVITLSRPHAARIDSALRAALVRSPDAAPFLREDREEPFFVKDVDRVSGDVRDAIVLTLGYGRSVDGRILYRFGALDRPGGDRRLVAATTRARERTTVVSCFGAGDLSPRRLVTPGSRALRDFLAYAKAPPPQPNAGGGDALALTVARRLQAAGASVVVGYGTGPGRIDVAVRHPKRRDRFVLAVETDGPSYAAMPSSRERDRIRPAQLARLGWNVHRVWSAAWAADPDGENARLMDAYAQAVADADAYDWAKAAAEADVVAGTPDEPLGDGDRPAGKEGGRPPKRRAPPFPVLRARAISAYTGRELAALARWVDSDGVLRSEEESVSELAAALLLDQPGPRATEALRHAVRVARAGAPEM